MTISFHEAVDYKGRVITDGHHLPYRGEGLEVRITNNSSKGYGINI